MIFNYNQNIKLINHTNNSTPSLQANKNRYQAQSWVTWIKNNVFTHFKQALMNLEKTCKTTAKEIMNQYL